MWREGNKKLILVAAMTLTVAGVTVGTAVASEAAAGDPAAAPKAAEGHRLFEHNCAHCHGEDARGDEGPDLHGLRKSDERLHKTIMNGIKGEMPAFGKKFKEADVEALIAYLRTLKE